MSLKGLRIEEVQSIVDQSSKIRYEYTFKRIVDQDELFVLMTDDEIYRLEDATTNRSIPVWSHPDLVASWSPNLEGLEIAGISVSEFVFKELPKLEAAGEKIAIFPTQTMKSIVLTPLQFAIEIYGETLKYL